MARNQRDQLSGRMSPATDAVLRSIRRLTPGMTVNDRLWWTMETGMLGEKRLDLIRVWCRSECQPELGGGQRIVRAKMSDVRDLQRRLAEFRSLSTSVEV